MVRDKRGELRRETRVLKAKHAAILILLASGRQDDHDERLRLQAELRHAGRSLEQLEWELLKETAKRRAIDIPSLKERPNWWDNDYEDGMPDYAVNYWINEAGRFGVAKLIQEERRKNFEWWFSKLILPIIQTLVPIVAMILVYLSNRRK